MGRPKARYPRECLECRQLPREERRPHKARGMCATHLRAWLRSKPQCAQSQCGVRLVRQSDSRQGYCRWHEHLLLQEPIRTASAIETTLINFERRLVADVELGCWLWGGKPNRKGYGLISVGNHEWLAHRYAFGAFIGGHAPGLTLDHICRRPNCVRPDHLMPMTLKRNIEREHGGAIAEASVLADLALLPWMPIKAFEWARESNLPVGRGEPGESGFMYGLDGEVIQHDPEPASYPRLIDLAKP